MSVYTTKQHTTKQQWEKIGAGVFRLARKACAKYGRYDDDAIGDTIFRAYKRHLDNPDHAVSSMIVCSAATVCLDDAKRPRPELLGEHDTDVPTTDDVSQDTSRLHRCTVAMPTALGETALAIGTADDCSQAADKLGVTKGCVSKRVRRMRALPCVTDLAIRHYGPYRALAVFVA